MAKKGVVSYFGEKTSYEVVSHVNSNLTTPSAFKTVDDMPDALKKSFEKFKSPLPAT
jgi:hypothetical protein